MRTRQETSGYVDKGDIGSEASDLQGLDDPREFERLFATESSPLKRYLTRFVSAADAEELAQEAFARVYAGGAVRLDFPKGFLFETARNLAISHIRRMRRAETVTQSIVTAASVQETPSVDEMLQQRQDLACVEAAIAHLPERRREIFLMRLKDDLSYAEIADKAGISLKGVESHLARGVEACHEFFERCTREGCAGNCRQRGAR